MIKKIIIINMKYCRICKSSKIKPILELNSSPLADSFSFKKNDPKNNKIYPLKKIYCSNCNYFGLSIRTSPKNNSRNFLYLSKTTAGLQKHFDDYSEQVKRKFSLNKTSLVVDLGSNDGLFINSFKKNGIKAIGVEPSNKIAKYANSKKLETINSFFNRKTVSKIIKEFKKPDVITANYMFANVSDVNTFTSNVSKLIKDDGIFIIQTGYHPEQMKINMFDYIYHEHFSYFTIKNLKYILSNFNLQIFDAEIFDPKGGSIRVFAKKNTNNVIEKTKRLIKIECKEISNRIFLESTYKKYSYNLNLIKLNLINKLKEYKNKNYDIIGFGASHSTTTLLYHFEIGEYIQYLIDDNVIKHNRYSPGLNLKVRSVKDFNNSKHKKFVIVLLAWQHQNVIIKKYKKILNTKSFFLIPLPRIKKIAL